MPTAHNTHFGEHFFGHLNWIKLLLISFLLFSLSLYLRVDQEFVFLTRMGHTRRTALACKWKWFLKNFYFFFFSFFSSSSFGSCKYVHAAWERIITRVCMRSFASRRNGSSWIQIGPSTSSLLPGMFHYWDGINAHLHISRYNLKGFSTTSICKWLITFFWTKFASKLSQGSCYT